MSTKNNKPKGLGRGLSAIFETESPNAPQPHKSGKTLMEEVSVSVVFPNPKQPRSYFDENALEDLADSIKVLGVIQPITVKSEGEGRYMIISGERRWRASQLAGLETIPAYIKEVDDQNLHEMALVENIQREDLNPMEVSMSLQRLMDECGLTQEDLSGRVGKKRSTIANYLRLLKMPLEVQYALRDGYISMGHAKAIAGAPESGQLGLLKRILKKGLSVRQSEELARKMAADGPEKEAAAEDEFPAAYTKLVESLERFFTQDISIRKDKKGGGKIVIGFGSDSDIEAFLDKFEKLN